MWNSSLESKLHILSIYRYNSEHCCDILSRTTSIVPRFRGLLTIYLTHRECTFSNLLYELSLRNSINDNCTLSCRYIRPRVYAFRIVSSK